MISTSAYLGQEFDWRLPHKTHQPVHNISRHFAQQETLQPISPIAKTHRLATKTREDKPNSLLQSSKHKELRATTEEERH